MTSDHTELLNRVKEFIMDHYKNHVNPVFVFHNLQHTEEVVAACTEMADYYKLPEDDRLALLVAAWFHDSGYSRGQAKGHESESQRIATEFLRQHQVPEHIIEKTNNCIEATRIPQSPTTLIGNIIADADLFHLGGDEFFLKSKLLRQELNRTHDEKVNKKDWRKINLHFLEGHHYFTEYAKQKLDTAKHDYMKQLNGKLEKVDEGEKHREKTREKNHKKDNGEMKEAEAENAVKAVVTEKEQEGGGKKKKEKEKDPKDRNERGISTMFRIMSNNQANLSSMADSKANIMISVNSIILSIMISGLLSTVVNSSHLQVPFFMLVIVCLTAIIFSILATRPKVTSGRFTDEDIYNKKVNLLFFGNFYNMSLTDYEWGMKELLKDRDYLYDTMIKDIYFLGIVLAKKYKFLRYSYNIFMYGLILVMIAFAVAIVFFSRDEISTLG